jgi:hypothetical protein
MSTQGAVFAVIFGLLSLIGWLHARMLRGGHDRMDAGRASGLPVFRWRTTRKTAGQ